MDRQYLQTIEIFGQPQFSKHFQQSVVQIKQGIGSSRVSLQTLYYYVAKIARSANSYQHKMVGVVTTRLFIVHLSRQGRRAQIDTCATATAVSLSHPQRVKDTSANRKKTKRICFAKEGINFILTPAKRTQQFGYLLVV